MSALARREFVLFCGLAVLVALVFAWMGTAYGMRMLVRFKITRVLAC